MQGRKENEMKTKKLIKEIMNDAPKYMKHYWNGLLVSEISYTTQYRYIRYALDFLNYIKEEYDINIKNANNLRDVKPSMITSYIVSFENCKGSIKASRFYGIKSFFKYLVNDGYIDINPCDKVNAPKDKEAHTITSLTKEEIEIIKNNILTGCGSNRAKKYNEKWIKRDYAIIMIGLSLGLRVTSLSEINLGDIDFENKEIKIVEKGNKTRMIPFSSNIENIIIEWIDDRKNIMKSKNAKSDALFVSSQMTRMTSSAISCLVKKYTYNIDKHITPHKLRSTCATNVYNSTGDIYLTADILGHSNIANTRRYAKIDPERRKKVAEAMDDILF